MLKKALNVVKLALIMAFVVAVGSATSLGVYFSVVESIKMPSNYEMGSLSNISKDLDYKEKRVVSDSRSSILIVMSSAENYDGYAKMSGTYVTHKGKYYVLTAAHGIVGECEYFFVATNEDDVYECIRYIIVDHDTDYAIIQVEKVEQRTPIDLRRAIPSNREWVQESSILNKVFYTGYPNSLGPLTFEGSIAGLSHDNYLYMHSYAWPGSSGSGVFSYDGNLIGVLIALNVGYTSAGYDILEDMVIVTPLFLIDWKTAFRIMEESEGS